MEMESSASRPLEIFVIPFLSPGHMFPLCEMASLFTARGHRVTIITTPSNAAHLHKATPRGGDFSFHAIPFPAKEVGLPEGLENFFDAKDLDTASKLHTGMVLLRREMEEFIAARRPDCVVSDMFHPWTADTAARLRIPRLVFHTACMFALCLKEAVRSPDSPHLRVKSDYEPFVFPGLPDPITMTRSQLPDYVRTPNGYTQMMEEWREAELKSYGVLFYNEKLVTQVLGIGVEVGKMDWNLWVDAGKEVVKRENVERAIRKLMDSGDLAAETRRQKAKELGEKARRAVEEGGSSHRNLTLLIEELKQLREEREKLLGSPEALSYTAPT
ncbi:hypothetical protein Acr_11g0016510 [Actinidia rufa]|uniref:Uncharacterized protein n=1 Tax=Actinidia rufa TaxID=165716 RepID=A0A7J0FFA5_9ERIC|nr:hypothetical protein Acr_11g0016510 [Actinidia rufa]